MRNIFRKTWLQAFALAGLLEVFSLIVFFDERLKFPAMILLGLASAFLALKDLRYPLALLVIESFIGSHGHLFSIEVGSFEISVRMLLFAVLFIAWSVHVLRGCSRIFHFPHTRVTAPLLFIIAMVVWGMTRAWSVGIPLSEAVADANGYVFIVMIPIMLDLASDRKSFAWLGKVASGALLWLSIKSLLLLYLFSHDFPFLSELYIWQRKAWLTEITRLDSGIYRIFAASDVFLLFGVFVGFILLWHRPSRARWISTILMTATFLLSLSRSFWLGALVAVTFMVPVMVRLRLLTRKTITAFFGRGIILFGSATILLFAVVAVPIPHHFSDTSVFSAFGSRLTGVGDAAVSSRWKMLDPLVERIIRYPILGSGFGRAITYQSDDPRIQELYPSGIITTTAIEWQYLEMMMKMGVFIILAIVWLWWRIGLFFWAAMRASGEDDRFILTGLMLAFLAFVLANVFTPYMNHPLGWVFLSFMLAGLHAVKEGEVENAPVHPRI